MSSNYPDNNSQNNTGANYDANYGGKPIEKPVSSEADISEEVFEEIPPYEAPPVVPRTLADTHAKKGGGNSKLIIICVSIVLIVAIIAAATVFAVMSLNKKDTESSAKKDTTPAVSQKEPEKDVPVEEPDDLNLTEPEEEPELFTMLVTVPDKSGAMADMIMLCVFDFENKDISLVSIPRDTYVSGDKLNAVVNGGNSVNDEKLIKTVEDITHIPIHHYLRTDIESVKNTVDLFGGVYYNVPQNMRYSDPAQNLYIDLKKGYQHINGDEAEQLLRFRSYPNGDIGRTETQRKFMIEAFKQCAIEENIELIPEWYNMVKGHSYISLSTDDLASIAELIVEKDYELYEYVIPHIFVDGESYVKVDYTKMLELTKELGF